MLQSNLSVADVRRRTGGAMLASTGSHGVCVGCTQPDIKRRHDMTEDIDKSRAVSVLHCTKLQL